MKPDLPPRTTARRVVAIHQTSHMSRGTVLYSARNGRCLLSVR
jgi:hypothetical protein